MTPRIDPAPSPEEAAAIVAALAGTGDEPDREPEKPSRWRMAGRDYGRRRP